MLRTYPAFMPCSATKPELVSDAPIADWRAPWLPRFPPSRFEQRISGQGQSNRERELDRRVQHVFLKRVDNAVFHFESFAHITLMSRFSRTGFGKPEFGMEPRTDCDNHHTRLSRTNQLYGYSSRSDLRERRRNLLRGDCEHYRHTKLERRLKYSRL
jgi:hypothetical protein